MQKIQTLILVTLAVAVAGLSVVAYHDYQYRKRTAVQHTDSLATKLEQANSALARTKSELATQQAHNSDLLSEKGHFCTALLTAKVKDPLCSL